MKFQNWDTAMPADRGLQKSFVEGQYLADADVKSKKHLLVLD